MSLKEYIEIKEEELGEVSQLLHDLEKMFPQSPDFEEVFEKIDEIINKVNEIEL